MYSINLKIIIINRRRTQTQELKTRQIYNKIFK